MISKTESALVRSCFRAGQRVLDFAIRLAIGAAIREHGTTLAEKRLGIRFNPSGDNAVSQIKRLAADFIDKVNAVEPAAFQDPAEVGRLKALLMTRAEDAAMWGSRRCSGRRRADMTSKPRPNPCCGLGYSPADPRQSEAEGKACAHAERLLKMVHGYCQIRDWWTGWVRGRSMRNTLQRIVAEMRALRQAEERVVDKHSVTLLAVLDYAAREHRLAAAAHPPGDAGCVRADGRRGQGRRATTATPRVAGAEPVRPAARRPALPARGPTADPHTPTDARGS